jgi:hypothetical protein
MPKCKENGHDEVSYMVATCPVCRVIKDLAFMMNHSRQLEGKAAYYQSEFNKLCAKYQIPNTPTLPMAEGEKDESSV